MTLARVRRSLQELWADPLSEEVGVLHVAAVGRTAGGDLVVIRVGEDAPQSSTDFFALSVARARADAIVTTGSILRAEPDLRHEIPSDLLSWRREVLGKIRPPDLVVLTRGKALPVGHPALDRAGVAIATSPEGRSRLAPRLGAGVELLELEDVSLRGLVAALLARGRRTVTVEAGPSAATELYEGPPRVDELLLSLYEEEALGPERIAGGFPSEEVLRATFGPPRSEVVRREPSGRWEFRRYLRSPSAEG